MLPAPSEATRGFRVKLPILKAGIVTYRADIDGLRAIAVTIVILFHFGITGFTGGFVGVDIFFVLSGYLIGANTFAQLNQHRFSFIDFYFRRLRRLFPVYIVVILATFLAAYWLMLPRDFREFGQSIVASTAYASNILFYMEAGYFDTASHLKPLLHTWSLSVEEQFYFVFPVVAWLTMRMSKRNLFILFGVLTATSLAAAIFYIGKDHSAVFYLYPFRAWEMFFGTLLALNYIPPSKNTASNYVCSILGLLLILVPTFTYDSNTLFPGTTAIAPCLGTVLLIHAGRHHAGIVQTLLATRIPVFIGKISYSLYLWHWPVYVLYTYSHPQGITHWDTLIIAALTVGLSVLSWRFVEAPFRHGKVLFSHTKIGVYGFTAIASAACIAIGLYLHVTNGMPKRLPPETAHFAEAASGLFGDLTGCKEEDNDILPHIGFCELGKPLTSDHYILVWGDSHGGAFKHGIETYFDTNKTPVLLAWTGGCPTLFGIQKDENVSNQKTDEACRDRNEAVKELLQKDARISAVVMIGRWSYYLNGQGVGVDDENEIQVWSDTEKSPLSREEQKAFFLETLHKTFTTLNDFDKKVFVVEQVPEFSKFRARPLAINLMNGSADFVKSVGELTVEDYQNVAARQQPTETLLASAEHEGLITVLRTHNKFCHEGLCSLMVNGYPTYFDNNHVSSYGAQQINDIFAPVAHYLEHTQQSPATKADQ